MFVYPPVGGADCARLQQVFHVPLYMLQLILAATDVGIAVCLSFLFDFLSRSFLHNHSYI